MVSVLDLSSTGPAASLSSATLDMLFTHTCLSASSINGTGKVT